MRISNATQVFISSKVRATLVSLGLVFLAPFAARATMHGDHDVYEWSANLVSFDEATATAVFQARVETYANIEGLDDFSDGDRLILSWTGRSWAAGVRDLARDANLEEGTLALPVEFVSTEREGRYVNFRVPVPDAYLETIGAMEPGTRVTGVSPKTLADWGSSIGELRHYNDID